MSQKITPKDLKAYAKLELGYRKQRWTALSKKQAKPVRTGKLVAMPDQIRKLSASELRDIAGVA